MPFTVAAIKDGSRPMLRSRVMLDAASIASSVLRTLRPLSAACMAIWAVLLIADRADHDDVRVLPEDGPQGVGESQVVSDRHRTMPSIKLVFDRILGGDDLIGDFIQFVQC